MSAREPSRLIGTLDRQRRDFLQGVAATTAVSAMPRTLFASDDRPTAVVIGAGIAGLSAAWDLRKAGFEVAIFEKEKFTGGRMVELQMGPLYQFTHAVGILGANREMFALARELGIEDELNGEPSNGSLMDNGHGVYDSGGITNFDIAGTARIPGLSPETIARLPLLQADLDEINATVDSCLLETGTAFDNESLGEYYERMLGQPAAREIISYKIEPACTAWGWPPYETSKIALLSWLARQEPFIYPDGGIGVLTRKLDSLLPVQNNTTVRYVTPPDSDGRHTIHYLNANLERRSVTPDVVVCAVEGKYLDKIIQDLTPKQEALARNCYFTKEPIVCWILDEQHAPREFVGGSYVPDHPDPLKAKTTYWFATPGDPAVNHPPHVRFALSRRHTPEWQRSDTALESFCWPMINHLYPQLEQSHVVDIVDYTCDDLIYIPVGFVNQMAEVLREQRQARRGLYLAGEYVAGAHTGAACASGRSVARDIIRHWL